MKKSFLDIVEEALVNVDEVDCIQLKHAKDNEEDFILIDSREREEWDASSIPNSVHMSKGLIEKNMPGRMVNIASIAAYNTTPQSAASLYSITKRAIVRMSEALAVEWSAKNINVNAIAPGAFSSEMMDGMIERVGDISQAFPRKRIGLPEQMDSTLLFLVSPSSECVTGTCIKIDDGQGSR